MAAAGEAPPTLTVLVQAVPPSLLKQTLAELRLIACFRRAAFQVLRCGGLQSESTLQSSLCQWQLVAADDVARELKRAAMSRSPYLASSLLSLLEPWLSTAEPPPGAADCPICYQVLHHATGQSPQLACPTCLNHFHAACLFTWFNRQREQDEDRSARPCPLCRSEIL